jgi:hypothetical protein
VPIRDGGGGDLEFGVRITADNQVFVNGVKAATEESKRLGDAVRGAGDAAESAGKSHENLTGAVFKGVGAMEIARKTAELVSETYGEMKEHTEAAQQSHARLEAVLRATNNASGQTAETIGHLADEMQRLTVFDDTQIRDASTTLLTFDKIAGDTFQRVIKLSADLASTGRGDLQTWVTVLGKVGQDPVQSIGLLERSLGKLDPALKVAIQNASDFNDKARAQALVLDEVERRVGGTAQESYRGLTRQMEGTKKAWDDLLRAMGEEIFNAKSKEASIFETQLRSMADNFKSRMGIIKEAWNSLPAAVRALFGDAPVQSQQEVLASQIAHMESVVAALQSGGQNSARAQGELARLRSQQSRMAQAAGPDPWNSEPGFAPALSQDPLTIRQRQALRDQDTQLQQAYWDHVFSLRQNDVQRSMQVEQQRHAALLESDSDYFAHVAQLEQHQVTDRIAQLQGDLAYEKQLLGSASAELARATSAKDRPDEIAAAEGKVADVRAKIRDITADLIDQERRWGDAESKRASAQYLADSQMMDRITAINRAYQDLETTLDRRVKDLEQERDLVGQTDEATRQANVAREIAVQFEDKRREILRQIQDIENDPNKHGRRGEAPRGARDLPQLFADVAEKSRGLIADIFSRKRSADMWSGLVGGLTDTFKAGWDAVVNHTGNAAKAMRDVLKRELFDWLYLQFAKPFVLNMIASRRGCRMGMSGIAQRGDERGRRQHDRLARGQHDRRPGEQLHGGLHRAERLHVRRGGDGPAIWNLDGAVRRICGPVRRLHHGRHRDHRRGGDFLWPV